MGIESNDEKEEEAERGDGGRRRNVQEKLSDLLRRRDADGSDIRSSFGWMDITSAERRQREREREIAREERPETVEESFF